tara:strand:- start:787 stop:1374 length:588 start_codon:yes stop_codon:yes gene_type:complete
MADNAHLTQDQVDFIESSLIKGFTLEDLSESELEDFLERYQERKEQEDNKPIYFYIVQGKENNDSSDDASTYYYKGNYTRKELERKVLIDYCKDQGIEDKDGKYFLQEYSECEYPIEVSMDIWDIFVSEMPISPLLEKEKPMTKKVKVTLLLEVDNDESAVDPLKDNCVLNTVNDGFFLSPVTVLDVSYLEKTNK